MDDHPATAGEPIVLVEPETGPSGEPYDRRELLQRYVDETREQLDCLAASLPSPRSQRRLHWALGAVTLLILAGVGFGGVALTRSGSAAQAAARQLALHEQDMCAGRQQIVMQAIARYTQEHQQPPADLSVLRPPLLNVPPVDPVSGVPYQYVREGNAVRLSCPKHLLPPETAAR